MPIIDSHFVRGKVSLEEICELYRNLSHYEKDGGPFVTNSKKQGTTMIYNIAQKEVSQLISKAREYGLDEFFPFFKRSIEALEKTYNLK